MFTALKRLCITLFTFLILSTSVFACGNDFYTRDSETLWGQSYQGNTDMINMITAIIIALIIIFVLFRTYKWHEKSFTKNEIPFTLFMGAFVTILVVWKAILWEFLFGAIFWIFGIIFFVVYLLRFFYQLFLLIRQTRQSFDNINMLFILSTVFYMIFLYFYVSERLWDKDSYTLILTLFTNIILLFTIYVIKSYRFRIFTICAFLIFTVLTMSIYPQYLYRINVFTNTNTLDRATPYNLNLK